jgi:predicted HD phosphohydrolase
MSNVVVIADWIKRLADDERKRDAVRVAQQEETVRKADVVRRHGGRLVDDVHAAILRDVESFRQEFPNDDSRDVVLDTRRADGGFVVSKRASPSVSLTVDPHLEAATLACHYRFNLPNGLPPRHDRFDVLFAGDAEALQMKHNDTGRVFATADALSEFLLVPVFTGRPR